VFVPYVDRSFAAYTVFAVEAPSNRACALSSSSCSHKMLWERTALLRGIPEN